MNDHDRGDAGDDAPASHTDDRASVAVDEDEAVTSEDATERRRSTAATWAAAGVLAVASVVALSVDQLTSGPTESQRRDDMTQVAEAFTVALTNYDYRDLGSTRQQVLDLAVRGFEQEFDRLLGGSGVQQALIENQAVATATVAVGPLVADFGDHEARTFTVVDQSVSGAGAAPSQQRLRVEVLLVETPDGWVVTGAEVT
jgi:hypothetical protein